MPRVEIASNPSFLGIFYNDIWLFLRRLAGRFAALVQRTTLTVWLSVRLLVAIQLNKRIAGVQISAINRCESVEYRRAQFAAMLAALAEPEPEDEDIDEQDE